MYTGACGVTVLLVLYAACAKVGVNMGGSCVCSHQSFCVVVGHWAIVVVAVLILTGAQDRRLQ